ncbi:hypothetical protein HanRHA438_Chr12g0563341 [Helianthus annuus]|nr:hypothetical protein HanRHA438_Chr12g0563341 [Helianthus annuus]
MRASGHLQVFPRELRVQATRPCRRRRRTRRRQPAGVAAPVTRKSGEKKGLGVWFGMQLK